ncbi:GlcNAc-PI synthesis protein [Aphelenchoides besseyi]|nr:GlcNAc-PI synthesis protein [Aphelenchoides besseyi]KAI6194785.1 GlcNAc-PI synthesis protein [Aphelenchoides besseyi]
MDSYCNQIRTINLVSDFFCPNTGGVETHLYHLGGCLRDLGHEVVVLTHRYGERHGIRYLSNDLKVYHIPFFCLPNGIVLPSVVGSLYWYRKILLMERIELVHGHSTFSSMAHEAMLHAWCMGIPTVFTDHSLFGFADFQAILVNKLLLRYSLANVHQIICVSHTSKENTVLRAGLMPSIVSVIPNAINSRFFTPGPPLAVDHPITIVVLCRLVYRKGADLLVEVIPEICRQHPTVQFIIGGDGPKRVELEEMRERLNLHSRVEMCGMLPHSRVREQLIRGHIFLNTSLTEAFCMAIVEAASCGLHVVSTRVGGIPEVLPDEFITLAEPNAPDIIKALMSAIKRQEDGHVIYPAVLHKAINEMYRWTDIAERTVKVYESVIDSKMSTRTGFENYWNAGWCFGIIWIVGVSINLLFLTIYDLFDKRENYRAPTQTNGHLSNNPVKPNCQRKTGELRRRRTAN